MWQRFTERARRTVFFAQEEAAGLGENYVSTEHFLLALTRENDHVAARIIDRLQLTLPAIREQVEKEIHAETKRGKPNKAQDMNLTPRAKRVIDLAYEEANALHNNYIGTEHLLLGLIREEDGPAWRVLHKLGVEMNQARAFIRDLQGENQKKTGGKENETPLSTVPAKVPQPGDLGVLRDAAAPARPQIEWAVSPEALVRLGEAMRLKDHHEYRALFTQNDFGFAGTNTLVKLLRWVPVASAAAPGGFFVRQIEGDGDGKTGWVIAEHFEWSGPDTRPFPPPVGDMVPSKGDAGEAATTRSPFRLNQLLEIVSGEKSAELWLIAGMVPIIRMPPFGVVPLEGNPPPVLDEAELREMLFAILSPSQQEMVEAGREMHFGYAMPEPNGTRFQVHIHTSSAKRLIVLCTNDEGDASENDTKE